MKLMKAESKYLLKSRKLNKIFFKEIEMIIKALPKFYTWNKHLNKQTYFPKLNKLYKILLLNFQEKQLLSHADNQRKKKKERKKKLG